MTRPNSWQGGGAALAASAKAVLVEQVQRILGAVTLWRSWLRAVFPGAGRSLAAPATCVDRCSPPRGWYTLRRAAEPGFVYGSEDSN